MYAVFLSGGKQHRVQQGDVLKLEKIEKGVGESINFDQVLMCGEGEKATVGAPYIEKATVTGEVVSQGRHKKVKILKFRRRKHSMKRMGHRQFYTEVKITKISAA